VIGRGSHIVAHQRISIGDDVYTGPYVYITDQNHSYADPELPIGRQWPVNSPVSIGSGTWLGTGVIVLPGAVIGRNVVVAAGSVVRGTIPDHCVIAGTPARVVRGYWPGAAELTHEDLSAQGPLDQVGGTGGVSQPPALAAIRGQYRLDRARRQAGTQLRPGGAVPAPGTFHARGQMVAGE
jgi:acyl-[acyl carrier protein]--UDP-N-acetylglucosamine O-acyltransferase